jgi:hypothetical protein
VDYKSATLHFVIYDTTKSEIVNLTKGTTKAQPYTL